MVCDITFVCERYLHGYVDGQTARARRTALLLGLRDAGPISLPSDVWRRIAELVSVSCLPSEWVLCPYDQWMFADARTWPRLHAEHSLRWMRLHPETKPPTSLGAGLEDLPPTPKGLSPPGYLQREMQALRVVSGEDGRSEVGEMQALLEEVVATSLGLTQRVLGSTSDTGEWWRAYGRNYHAFGMLSDLALRPTTLATAFEHGRDAVAPLECMRDGWPDDLSDGVRERLDDFDCRASHCSLSALLATDWDAPAGAAGVAAGAGQSRRQVATNACAYLERLRSRLVGARVPTHELRLLVAFD